MIRRENLGSFVFLLLLVAGFVGLRSWAGRTAPVPEVFLQTPTLAAARERGEAEGKPVFALATADWCAPCQSLKRGALTDPRVAAWLTAHTIPVSVDVTTPPPPSSEEAALGIHAIPAMILLEDGREVGRLEGVIGPDELLSWLRTHAGER